MSRADIFLSRDARCARVRVRSVAYHAYEGGYKVWGNAYKPSERGMASMIYIFFVSKIYEFMDTFIMLLKGNLQQVPAAIAFVRHCASHARIAQSASTYACLRSCAQVTVLHVYHHASISFIWWMITHTAPGGDAYFSAALNSFVVRSRRGTDSLEQCLSDA